jgi:hypothetical protein
MVLQGTCPRGVKYNPVIRGALCQVDSARGKAPGVAVQAASRTGSDLIPRRKFEYA